MRVTRKAFIVFFILSILTVHESSPFLFKPASANLLFTIPLWLFRIFRTLSFRKISAALTNLRSFLRSNGGRIRIGDTIDGLSKIKDYFNLLGYLNSTLNSDAFSAELESAIELFQKTFHLNVTGRPDNATMSLIKLPRCALPDVTTLSWPPEGKKELTYAFSPENKTMAAAFKGVFADAFRRWSNVTKLNFSETTSFREADIQIMFASMDGELGVVGGAWLDNNTRKVGKIILDSHEKWMSPESDELDLETEVMHQIGHVLGLSHSGMEEAIMYPFIVPWRKKKLEFSKYDMEKIQKLYST